MPLVSFKIILHDMRHSIYRILLRAISRDPVAFPDPETFDPQRWLDSECRVRDDMKSFAFGFGRR